VLKLVFGRSKPQPPRTNEIDAIFQRSRTEQATADQKLAKVVEVIADLFVSPRIPLMPTHCRATSCMAAFRISCARQDYGAAHKHPDAAVVMSPVQIIALVR